TYADAYEWKVAGGDVVKALTKTKPVRTPLPGEVQGESITYSRDGSRFVTATEAVGSAATPQLYSYEPAKAPPPKAPKKADAEPGWFDNMSLQDIRIIIAVIGVLGVLLLVVGIWGIRRHRKSFPRDREYYDDEDPYRDDGPGGRGNRGRGDRYRDPRGGPRPSPRGRDPRDYDEPTGSRAAGRATVGPPPARPRGERGGPSQGRAPAPRDLPPRRGPATGSSRVPPPSRSGRVPPPSGPARGSPSPGGRSRIDDPHFGQQPPSGEYW
ncbi:MAG: hypothetical protein ACRD0P_34530, partial [Stackebrandtia sp.]